MPKNCAEYLYITLYYLTFRNWLPSLIFLAYTISDPFYVALNKLRSRLYVDILIKEQQRIQRIAARICVDVS